MILEVKQPVRLPRQLTPDNTSGGSPDTRIRGGSNSYHFTVCKKFVAGLHDLF